MSKRLASSLLLGPICLLLLLTAVPSASAANFNASADWSFFSNPNGVWSYNGGSTPLPGVIPGWGGIVGEQFWAFDSLPPSMTRAQTTLTGGDWLPGDVILHSTTPATGRGLVNLTWTSPFAGTIDISGRAWDAFHYSDREDRWALILNGVTLAERDAVRGIGRADAGAPFLANLAVGQSLTGLPVQAGDVLEFQVEALTPFGHLVGVELDIDATPSGPPVPEPSSLVLMGAGLVVAAARRRRAHQA